MKKPKNNFKEGGKRIRKSHRQTFGIAKQQPVTLSKSAKIALMEDVNQKFKNADIKINELDKTISISTATSTKPFSLVAQHTIHEPKPIKKFVPSKNLIKFATQFSKKYKKVSAGVYKSDCGKYELHYLNKLISEPTGKPIETLWRVSSRTGIMEFNRIKTRKYKHDVIFFGIIQSQALFKTNGNYLYSDETALNYALKHGYNFKILIKAFTNIIKDAPTELNKSRMEHILEITPKLKAKYNTKK